MNATAFRLGLLAVLFITMAAPTRPVVAATGDASKEYRVLQDRPDRLLVELPNRMMVMVQEVRTSPVVPGEDRTSSTEG